MSGQTPTPDWWLASDGNWYPPVNGSEQSSTTTPPVVPPDAVSLHQAGSQCPIAPPVIAPPPGPFIQTDQGAFPSIAPPSLDFLLDQQPVLTEGSVYSLPPIQKGVVKHSSRSSVQKIQALVGFALCVAGFVLFYDPLQSDYSPIGMIALVVGAVMLVRGLLSS